MNQTNFEVKMKILKAAKILFASKGYDQTSVRDICNDAGVNIMMISYHFQGKENVLSSIFQSSMQLLDFTGEKEATENPILRLTRIVRNVSSLRINDPDMMSILQQEITLPKPRNEIIQFLITPLWSELEELLLLGKRLKLFKYDSLETTIIFIISSVFMSRQLEFFNRNIQDPVDDIEEITTRMSSLILGALKCPEQELKSILLEEV
ncbi:AcrR family transcriptional regulator [Paenibacillus phyllosphaerae]|uniref:AcrR family transcriptional regulator n=1 Tax=Paenibacillus phyllosphaerae TaxID=274593 RepID=A0A7W5B0E9_9BACL|nr:TetR family transcriptional regulator [Paenibacillus phyllosphaerae]MBB3112117.1 AcrR family transcriptional regulator [Paenibacillus phyllosphaerae]